MHGVGFCDELCVSESADVSLDMQVMDKDRVRATMEISTVVGVECSQETFIEIGGGSGLTNNTHGQVKDGVEQVVGDPSRHLQEHVLQGH